LERRDDGEGGDAGLGRAVVGLADVAVDARRRRGVDDAAVDLLAGLRLLAPVGSSPPGGGEGALEVDLDDEVPLLLGHVGEHAVAEDAGVVDEDVETAEGLDRLVDHALGGFPVADVGAVDDGLAPHAPDLLDDLTGGAGAATGAVHLGTEVVDDDLRSLSGHHQRVLAADAPTGTGDDGDSSFEDSAHRVWFS